MANTVTICPARARMSASRWRVRASARALAHAGVLACLLWADTGQVYGQPVGEPVGDYPNYQERLMMVAMNRARADPNNVAAGTAHDCSTERASTPPLMWDHDASQAARFHCANLAMNDGGLSHDSYCTLRTDIEATGCDGSAACACEPGSECWSCTTGGGCGTNFSGRMNRFGFTGSPRGENSAVGYGNSWSVVEAWMTESPCTTGHEGHRNINTGDNVNVVGAGFANGGSCWPTFYYSDYGVINGLQTARIPSGIHRPETGNAGTDFTFYANYYDPAGPPSQMSVVIDGACQAMTSELGAGGNRTYTGNTTMADGCRQYYFLAIDAAGNRSTFPEAGSLQVAVGGSGACPGDYEYSQMAADCECGDGTCNVGAGENCVSCEADCGACPDTCGDGVCDPGDAINCPDDCAPDGPDAGPNDPPDAGPGNPIDPVDPNDPNGPNVVVGTCGCRADGPVDSPAGVAAGLLLVCLLALRRRRGVPAGVRGAR